MNSFQIPADPGDPGQPKTKLGRVDGSEAGAERRLVRDATTRMLRALERDTV